MVDDAAVAGIIRRTGSIGGALPEVEKKQLPLKQSADSEMKDHRCTECKRPIEQAHGRGRPRITCGQRCRLRRSRRLREDTETDVVV